MDDAAHFGERRPAPVTKFLDFCVDRCRGSFTGMDFFMIAPTLAPNLAALSVTCNLLQKKPAACGTMETNALYRR